MTVKEIIDILQVFPENMPVNMHLQYNERMILRCPSFQIKFVDQQGTIVDEPMADMKEISLFVEEALYMIRRRNPGIDS